MKKVLLILLVLILSGCSNSCSLFYTDECKKQDEIAKYVELGYKQETAEKIFSLSQEIKDNLLNVYNSDYEEIINSGIFSEENLYAYSNSKLDIDTFLYLKANKYEINNNFMKLYNDPFFILEKLDFYLKYEKDFNDTRSLVEYVNTKAYKKPYEEYELSDLTKGNLIIASKIYYLDKYEPSDLIDADKGYYVSSSAKMKEEAWLAYKEMADAAREEKLYFYISTAYRSFEQQEKIYNNYLKNDSQEVVDTYSSRAGFSDHQIGLTCDLRLKNGTFDGFGKTKEAKWLKENAYKYGYIQRYPEGKQAITGYMEESWHYRYVGKEAAKIIHENNITFDEYYAYYVEQK